LFQGGKDHASYLQLYTELNCVTRLLFPVDDDKLLEYLNEDGRSIEPNWYFVSPFFVMAILVVIINK
jgi:DNA topoisomerase II